MLLEAYVLHMFIWEVRGSCILKQEQYEAQLHAKATTQPIRLLFPAAVKKRKNVHREKKGKKNDEERITLLTQCAYVISSDPNFSTRIRP